MAAKTTKFKSLRIVPEDVYGYGSVPTGATRPTGAIFDRAVALPVDAGELTVPDQPMVATIDQARAAFYNTPDEVDGLD
ncbi:MAG: hypothetical protein KC620_22785, partial [Myxococcales bacterium]|nr:hypothetical protein [Myxococcales bacterium]